MVSGWWSKRDQLIFFGLIGAPFLVVFSRWGIPLTFMILLPALGLWYVRGTARGEIEIVPSPAYFFLMVFTLAMVFSILGPVGSPLGKIRVLLSTFIGLILPVFFLLNTVRSWKQLSACLDYLLSWSAFSSLVGIAQLAIYGLTGAVTTFAANQEEGRLAITAWGTFPRATGFTVNPNYFGVLLGLCTAMAVCLALSLYCATPCKRRLFWGGAMIGTLALLCTYGRGALLSLILTLLLFSLLRRPAWLLYYGLGFPVLALIGYLSGLVDRVLRFLVRLRAESVSFRGIINVIGWRAVKKYPVTGLGIGMFQGFNDPFTTAPHIVWLWVAAEVGALGALVLLAYYLTLGLRLARAIAGTQGGERAVLEALFLSLAFCFVASLFEPFFQNKFFWFLMGLCEAAIRLRKEGKVEKALPLLGYP